MKELLNFRYYVLIALAVATVALFFAESDAEDTIEWLQFHITNKTIALVLGLLGGKVYEYWNVNNRIPMIAKMCFTLKRLTDERD